MDAVHDLTLQLHKEILLYPGDSPPVIDLITENRSGDRLTSSHLSLGCHVGTHVDAPAHFLRDGMPVDKLPIDRFFGPAIVVGIYGKKEVGVQDIKFCSIPKGYHVLLKTENSRLLESPEFSRCYTYLDPGAAAFLCELEPRSVGIDYYSFDPFDCEDFPSHTTFAKHNIPAFVCLNLAAVSPGIYFFAGLPLRLPGTEASPVRAILWR